MRRLHRLFLLPYKEKKLLLRSLVLIVIVRVGLWIFPFNLLHRWLNNVTPVAREATDWAAVKRVVGSVKSASRFLPYATCLTQALAARLLLGLDGQPSNLKIGVEKDPDDKFGAHAWVEIDGRIVIGKLPRHGRFAVLN